MTAPPTAPVPPRRNPLAILIAWFVRIVVLVMILQAPALFGFPHPFDLAVKYGCERTFLRSACAWTGLHDGDMAPDPVSPAP
ncbi:MAG: hypothetical protein NW200_12355 [Hyphomonadaceae bacterium]|nr:hypothetical protein [Hyphomonadaceae bacterium]